VPVPNPANAGEEKLFPLVIPFLRSLTGENPGLIVVVKLGSRGAAVLAEGALIPAETKPLIPQDSTGAGDAFAAAFLAARLRGKPLEECAALGNLTAGKMLAVPGTRISGEALAPLAKALGRCP
jgi:sugar/nucleoside kinase (ribokinase family)